MFLQQLEKNIVHIYNSLDKLQKVRKFFKFDVFSGNKLVGVLSQRMNNVHV